MRWVVTAASRGIGLEFVKQLVARGELVEAAARDPEGSKELAALCAKHPDRVRTHRLDVASGASVAAFAERLAAGPIDVLLNVAGITGKRTGLEDLDVDDALRTFDVNAMGSLRVLISVLPRLGKGARVVSVTSGLGSIGDNTSGGAYGYRMSKAALNMAMKSAALNLKDKGVTCVVVNPGWVQTDMGGSAAPLAVDKSVSNMLKLVDGLTLEQTGRFLDHSGKEWPW